ncbi:Lrp/AsnC family transcriptional regulator [Microbacterium mangrovi]|uniref:Lrp/AsnC family transcriptional regulator n=1 Tax=Microbacterium mangrovi TaxID=1348253 RepID=UPI0006906230|nr:Lrp/AsnC family transcriptional regulator [Microbacterium mangrovi]
MDATPGLDDLDLKIVAALQIDGRRSFSNLGEELGVPASSIRYRAKRLQDEGILQVVGIANPLAIGFDLLAIVGVRTSPGTARDVCAALSAMHESSYVVMTSGRFDVLVEVIARDIADMTDVLQNKIGSVPGVLSTESFFVLEVAKLAYGWGVPAIEGLAADSSAPGTPTAD